MFVHIVLFWMKEDAPADATAKTIANAQKYLTKISTIRTCEVGRPAMTPRDVVDNSYAVGLCTIFDDKAGHDAYQVDPLHLEFVKEGKPFWSRVLIYDFVM